MKNVNATKNTNIFIYYAQNRCMQLYSDLIIEANAPLTFTSITNSKFGIDIAEHDISEKLGEKLGKKSGKYVSMFLEQDTKDNCVVELLKKYISKMCNYLNCDMKKVLVVGLGNADYIVDSLGEATTKKINPKHNKLMLLNPDVNANTGIESATVVRCLCSELKPTICIAIDTIATISQRRLGMCYQMTSAGIQPGGGIDKNKKLFIDQEYLTCPIIAIGFPLILSTNYGFQMPYNIEDVIKKASDCISKAINSFF